MSRRAFTLIELLVVVAIIALLIAILLPSLDKARATARSVVCASNEHQLFMACNMYATDYKGTLPPNVIQGSTMSNLIPQTWHTRYFRSDSSGLAAHPWQNLGNLYAGNYVADNNHRLFYCPDTILFPAADYEPWPLGPRMRVPYNFNPIVDPAKNFDRKYPNLFRAAGPTAIFMTDVLSDPTGADDMNHAKLGLFNVARFDGSAGARRDDFVNANLGTQMNNYPLYLQMLQALAAAY